MGWTSRRFSRGDVCVRLGDDEIVLDARPSDSIALAVRARAPIYMADDVMEQVDSDIQGRRSVEEQRRGARERQYEEAATPVTPEQREKLSAFSELMESLTMDDDGGEEVPTA